MDSAAGPRRRSSRVRRTPMEAEIIKDIQTAKAVTGTTRKRSRAAAGGGAPTKARAKAKRQPPSKKRRVAEGESSGSSWSSDSDSSSSDEDTQAGGAASDHGSGGDASAGAGSGAGAGAGSGGGSGDDEGRESGDTNGKPQKLSLKARVAARRPKKKKKDRGPPTSAKRSPWTHPEDQALWDALKVYGANYAAIAKLPQLCHRSLKSIEQHTLKITTDLAWTTEQDNQLLELMNEEKQSIRRVVRRQECTPYRSERAIRVRIEQLEKDGEIIRLQVWPWSGNPHWLLRVRSDMDTLDLTHLSLRLLYNDDVTGFLAKVGDTEGTFITDKIPVSELKTDTFVAIPRLPGMDFGDDAEGSGDDAGEGDEDEAMDSEAGDAEASEDEEPATQVPDDAEMYQV